MKQPANTRRTTKGKKLGRVILGEYKKKGTNRSLRKSQPRKRGTGEKNGGRT